jgi:hypothetical protein
MKTTKYCNKVLAVLFLVFSFNIFAQTAASPATSVQQQIPTTKNKLSDACSKAYSGSSNQVEDCITCARNAADINSRRFITCMGSFETINERRNGQTGLDDLIGNTPNCIKGVKSFGC